MQIETIKNYNFLLVKDSVTNIIIISFFTNLHFFRLGRCSICIECSFKVIPINENLTNFANYLVHSNLRRNSSVDKSYAGKEVTAGWNSVTPIETVDENSIKWYWTTLGYRKICCLCTALVVYKL
jgi:hypothetical protein